MGKLFTLLVVGILLVSCGGDDGDSPKEATCHEAITHWYNIGCTSGTLSLPEAIDNCLQLKYVLHQNTPACDDDHQRVLDCQLAAKSGQCSSCSSLYEKLYTCS